MKPISMFDTDTYRVSLGGGWGNAPSDTRLSYRGRFTPSNRYGNVGFRSCWTIR